MWKRFVIMFIGLVAGMVAVYKGLGGALYSPVGGEPRTIPGVDVTFWLNESGIYQISIYEDSSEITYDLGIEGGGTYGEVLDALGNPSSELIRNDTAILSYKLSETDDNYVYFIFDREHIIEHGLAVGSLTNIDMFRFPILEGGKPTAVFTDGAVISSNHRVLWHNNDYIALFVDGTLVADFDVIIVENRALVPFYPFLWSLRIFGA